MSDAPELPEDDQALAAEYVLRLMDADAERAFEVRLVSEPALLDQVRLWEADFASLAESIPETVPPAIVKRRVMEQLSGNPKRAVFGFWRWFLPSALAVVAAAFLFLSPILRGPDFDPAFHASLLTDDGSLQIEAGLSPDNNLFKVLRPVGDPRPGRALEIWIIADGSDTPVSLGVLPDEREILFEMDPELADLIEDGTMAVSDEPLGGSPTGAPTGDILATGVFFDL